MYEIESEPIIRNETYSEKIQRLLIKYQED